MKKKLFCTFGALGSLASVVFFLNLILPEERGNVILLFFPTVFAGLFIFFAYHGIEVIRELIGLSFNFLRKIQKKLKPYLNNFV